MKTILYFSENEKEIGAAFKEIGLGFGIDVIYSEPNSDIRERCEIAVISESVPSEPGTLMQNLSQEGAAVYFLSSQSGLSIYNQVRQNGGKGIISLENAAGDFKSLLRKQVGKNRRNQYVKKDLREPESERNLTKNRQLAQYNTQDIKQSELTQKPPHASPVQGGNQAPYRLSKELIVVYAFKGGVGKSTLAANLAVEMASLKQPKQSVVLVDFDVNSAGRLADMLNIYPTTTILDWVATKYVEDISSYLVDGPGGIKVLLAPRLPHDERAVTFEVAEKAIQTLCRRFDVVIIDTPMILRDSTIVALDLATKIFLLATPDRPTLRGVYQISQTLKNLKIDPAKIHFVLNRVPKRSSIRIDDFRDVIPYQLLTSIPEDPAVQLAVNRENLPCMDKRAKAFSAGLHKIVNSVLPGYRAESAPKKLIFPSIKLPFFKRR